MTKRRETPEEAWENLRRELVKVIEPVLLPPLRVLARWLDRHPRVSRFFDVADRPMRILLAVAAFLYMALWAAGFIYFGLRDASFVQYAAGIWALICGIVAFLWLWERAGNNTEPPTGGDSKGESP